MVACSDRKAAVAVSGSTVSHGGPVPRLAAGWLPAATPSPCQPCKLPAALYAAMVKGDPATVVQLHGIRGVKGAVVKGTAPLVELETGMTEPLSVVIATGHEHTTPRFLVSANIHGNEVNGLIVAHRLIAALEEAVAAKTLVGTVVVYPCLNPTGLRAATRTPSYSSDANRLWPSQEPKGDVETNDTGKSDESSSSARRTAAGAADEDPLAGHEKWDALSSQEEAWVELLAEWGGGGFDYHATPHAIPTTAWLLLAFFSSFLC